MARHIDNADTRVIAATGAVAAAGAAAVAGTASKVRARRRKRARRYRLEAGEPMPDGVRRIALGQLDLVADDIAAPDDGPDDEAVHEARKAFKRLRALLRVNRDQLGDDIRRRENAAFRDAGRRLSGARDARVVVATFDDLTERNQDSLPPGAFAGLHAVLATAAARPGLRIGSEDAAAVAAEVEEARGRVAAWPLEGVEAATLAAGLARIQRRGRRAYREAKADPSSEHLHELRKRTKDLWHAAQILRPAAPKRMRKLATRAHELSDLLGENHDLALLRDAVDEHANVMAPGEQEQLRNMIDRRQAKLRRRALRCAGRIYGTKPRKLARLVS